MKTLRLFNGRGQFRRDGGRTGHIYLAAWSVADAVRALQQAGFLDVSRREVEDYFSPDCWGNCMDGIAPERGVWAMPYGFDYADGVRPIRYL